MIAAAPLPPLPPRLRLDKWLWFARFHKSRSLASAACAAARIRLNGVVVDKAHQKVAPGDVLTFPLGARIRIVRVVALGHRRGPAPEAQALYEDLSPPDQAAAPASSAVRPAGAGRPTKAERRALDRLRDPDACSEPGG